MYNQNHNHNQHNPDQRRRRNHGDDIGEAAAAALIDSYFLPGGILDPEEMHGHGHGQQSQSQPPNLNQDPPRLADENNYASSPSVADAMRSRLDRAMAIGGASLGGGGGSGTRSGIRGSGEFLNRAGGGAATGVDLGTRSDYNRNNNNRMGVGALDPSSDDVVGGMPIFGMPGRNMHQHQQRSGSAALNINSGNVSLGSAGGGRGGGLSSMMAPAQHGGGHSRGMNNHMNMNNMTMGMNSHMNTSGMSGGMDMNMNMGGYTQSQPQAPSAIGGMNINVNQNYPQSQIHPHPSPQTHGNFGFTNTNIQTQPKSEQQPSTRNLTSTPNWFGEPSTPSNVNVSGYSQQQDEFSDLLGALQQQQQQSHQPKPHEPIGSAMQMLGREGHLSTYSSSNDESQSRATSMSAAATHLHHNHNVNNPWGNSNANTNIKITNSNSNSHESLSKKVESSNSLQFGPATGAAGGGGSGGSGNAVNVLPKSASQVSNHHLVQNNHPSSSLSLNNTNTNSFPHESVSSTAAAANATGILGKSSSKSLSLGSALHPHPVKPQSQPQSQPQPSSVLPQSVRPPPGFSSSSSRSRVNVNTNLSATDPSPDTGQGPQGHMVTTHATSNANATSTSSMDRHNNNQQTRIMTSTMHNSARYSHGVVNHEDNAAAVAEEQERERQLHQHQQHHHISSHAAHGHGHGQGQGHATYRNKRYAPHTNIHQHQHHHHHDGDYDLASLNSKSSRDVPSTIYVRSGSSNTDEEELTACADSITVASLPVNKVENEPLDVLEETSAPVPTEEKKTKPKRPKKKRNKKKQQQQVQESTKSQDTTVLDGSEEPSNNNNNIADLKDEGEVKEKEKEETSESNANANNRKSARNHRREKLQAQKKPKNNNASSGRNTQKQSSSNSTSNGNAATKNTSMNLSKSQPQQDNSRTSAATTAISSTTTAVQRVSHKKKEYNKPINAVQSQSERDNDRNEVQVAPKVQNVEERKVTEVVVQKQQELTPQVPLTEHVSSAVQKVQPIVASVALALFSIASTSLQFIFGIIVAWIPRKERFWFLLPAFAVTIDFIFLITCLICKVFGKILYLFLLCHKLAFLELLESESAALCYAVIFFYPNIVDGLRFAIPYQDYWPVFARWLAVDRWFCRPITMKETYLYRLRKLDRRQNAMKAMSNSAQAGDSMAKSMKEAVDVVLDKSKEDELPESERVTMANHILLILRKVTPLILMLEINIHRDGFLMLMTNTERTLFGYGLAVLRSGYLFSSMIWISWTIQLTLVMFAPSNTMWCHFIFVIGLVSIRVSHYTAAVEDYEGVDSLNSHSTSNRRKKASRLFL